MHKPLDGLRVIDMTHVLAGPYCTYQLGLLGAEVIKIESPRGDLTRPWGGTAAQIKEGLGTGFAAQNAGKRSVSVDIKQQAGSDVIRKLVTNADIFVENYRPGTMADYGLDYETLCEINPKLIYLSISAFGQNGPHGHRPGFDDVIQATSGFMSINVRGDGPIRTGGPVLDYASGMHATSAVLAAVLLRLQTGQGQRIDIAMQDVTMLLMNRHSSIVASTGEEVPPMGNRDGFLLGRYAVKDGYVMLAGYAINHKRDIQKAIGLEEAAALTSKEITATATEIEIQVEETLLHKTASEWDKIFSNQAVVAGGVRSLVEVINTGQPAAREMFSSVDSVAGTFQVTTAGYRINDEVFRAGPVVPKLGQDSQAVLSESGFDQDAIDQLIADGIVH